MDGEWYKNVIIIICIIKHFFWNVLYKFSVLLFSQEVQYVTLFLILINIYLKMWDYDYKEVKNLDILPIIIIVGLGVVACVGALYFSDNLGILMTAHPVSNTNHDNNTNNNTNATNVSNGSSQSQQSSGQSLGSDQNSNSNNANDDSNSNDISQQVDQNVQDQIDQNIQNQAVNQANQYASQAWRIEINQ